MDIKGRQLERSGNEAGLLAHRVRLGELKRFWIRYAAWLGHKPSMEYIGEGANVLRYAQSAPNNAKMYLAADVLDQQLPEWEANNLDDEQWMHLTQPYWYNNVANQSYLFQYEDLKYGISYRYLSDQRDRRIYINNLRSQCLLHGYYPAIPRAKELFEHIFRGSGPHLEEYQFGELLHPGVISLFHSYSQGQKFNDLVRVLTDSIEHDPLRIYKHNTDRTIAWLLS